jgi:phytoene/squalene synthetase
VSRGVEVDDALGAEFRDHLESRGLTIDDEAFAAEDTFIRAMMHYEIDLALFSVEEARRNLTASDPQAQFAITLFPEAERLLGVSRGAGAVAADQ